VDQIIRHHEPFDGDANDVLSIVNALGYQNKLRPANKEKLGFAEIIGVSEVALEELKEQTLDFIGELSSLFGGN
jgi:hypothetical protein